MAGFGLGNYINPAVGGFIDQRRNALAGLGAGLLSGRPGAGVQEGIQADTAFAVMQKAEDERAKNINQTQQWLQANYPQYANLPADQGWQAAMADLSAKRNTMATDPADTYSGRVRIGQEQGLTGSALTTFALTGKLPEAAGAADAPSGYQWTPENTLTFIPGGPHDPANKPQGSMSATMQKELFEADETVVAGQGVTQALDTAIKLNETAIDGPFAEQRAYAGALMGDPTGQATLELKNIVTQQALEQLKVIFGAMPTEGERKILLEIQGSVDQPRAVRAKIYQRARELAERRIAANQQKAQALRSGQYFEEGFSPLPAAAPGATSTGVQWSYEP